MNGHAKVDIGTRFIAALIDGVLSSVVGFIPIIGAIIGAAYMLVKDGLFEGQSLGKKVMKLQVVTEEGKKADFGVSAKRNVIFAIPVLIMIIPILGWIIAPIVSIVILVIEILKVVNEPLGRRLGDKWGGTQVIKFEEADETEQPVAPVEPQQPVDSE